MSPKMPLNLADDGTVPYHLRVPDIMSESGGPKTLVADPHGPNTHLNQRTQEVFVSDTKHGATKADGEKLDRFDLLPWDIIMELAELYGIGARKYDDRNWEKGMSWGRLIRALFSHMAKFLLRRKYDPVDGQRHIISVIWCGVALAYYEKHEIGTDDRAHVPKAVLELAETYVSSPPMTKKEITDYELAQAEYDNTKP